MKRTKKILLGLSVIIPLQIFSQETNPNKMVSFFEKTFGKHDGERRNHITGFCFSGSFYPNDEKMLMYSKASFFKEPTKVTGRFSHKDGIKKDENKPGHLGMAFESKLKNAEVFMTALNTLDFFPVATAEGFYKVMKYKATKDKKILDDIKKNHSELLLFKKYSKKNPLKIKGYENAQYNSLNSFILKNEKGDSTPVRWSFIPKDKNNVASKMNNVNLFEIMKDKIKDNGSVAWDMVITLANKNDDIDNSSIPWSGYHKQIHAGTLIVNNITQKGSCTNINFDPLILPKGIEPSNDSILLFRSPVYAITHGKRLSEQK